MKKRLNFFCVLMLVLISSEEDYVCRLIILEQMLFGKVGMRVGMLNLRTPGDICWSSSPRCSPLWPPLYRFSASSDSYLT